MEFDLVAIRYKLDVHHVNISNILKWYRLTDWKRDCREQNQPRSFYYNYHTKVYECK